MYGLPGKNSPKRGSGHMSVMESPMNTARDSPATGTATAAFASRYRARFGQSCRFFAFLATVSSSRATCFDNGVMSGACALQIVGNELRQLSATAESGTEIRMQASQKHRKSQLSGGEFTAACHFAHRRIAS